MPAVAQVFRYSLVLKNDIQNSMHFHRLMKLIKNWGQKNSGIVDTFCHIAASAATGSSFDYTILLPDITAFQRCMSVSSV